MKNAQQIATTNRGRASVDWTEAFLKALEGTGVVVKACEAAGIDRSNVWRRKQSDPEFAKAYEESLRTGALLLEAEAVRRASEGLVRKKFTKAGAPIIDPATGEQYVEHEYSDTLLALLLRRHIPEYREPKGELNVSTAVHNHFHMSESDLRQIQAERQRFLAS
jgi:hypothetical protein